MPHSVSLGCCILVEVFFSFHIFHQPFTSFCKELLFSGGSSYSPRKTWTMDALGNPVRAPFRVSFFLFSFFP